MNDALPSQQPAMEEELVCRCPEHWPKWAGKDMDFAGWCVHRMKIAAFAHMPVSYEVYLDKQTQNIADLGLTEKWPGLVLTRTGWFGGEILRVLEPESSPSRSVEYLTPPFHVNVMLHEGGIGTVTRTAQIQQSNIYAAKCKPKELYLAHLSCPVCAERKGGEKILLIRRWIPGQQTQRRMKDESKR
ncbi:MAG: hypothetical protein OEW58_04285 [Gammaproteobacteria bacterium]|nr:hypothetical protein [Gammaproteobacteria bacterium]